MKSSIRLGHVRGAPSAGQVSRDGGGARATFAADHLVEDDHVAANFVHALTVDHRTNGTVYRWITADTPLEIDTHRDAPIAPRSLR